MTKKKLSPLELKLKKLSVVITSMLSSLGYSDIGYAVNPVSNSSTSVSLAGTTPLHVVTTSVSITAVTLSANPAEGHSCHVIFANSGSSDLTVAVTHHSTNRVCPGGTDPDPLTIPAGGYVEMDFLTANGKVYVRGV